MGYTLAEKKSLVSKCDTDVLVKVLKDPIKTSDSIVNADNEELRACIQEELARRGVEVPTSQSL
jgi:hypothetical protein